MFLIKKLIVVIIFLGVTEIEMVVLLAPSVLIFVLIEEIFSQIEMKTLFVNLLIPTAKPISNFL